MSENENLKLHPSVSIPHFYGTCSEISRFLQSHLNVFTPTRCEYTHSKNSSVVPNRKERKREKNINCTEEKAIL
jgi:hypothetical protein